MSAVITPGIPHVYQSRRGVLPRDGRFSMRAATSLRATTFIVLLLVSSAAIAGCSTPMRKTTARTDSVGRDSARVNFVRPRVWWSDGSSFDLWDGDRFIGVISAGSMIQYRTQPGDHVFMLPPMSGSEDWSYVKANLAGGKQYFVKVNVRFSGSGRFGVAHAKEDDRTEIWLTKLQPMETVPEEVDSYLLKRRGEAKEALRNFLNGRARYVELHPEDGM
jgi:hypothetical protein